jgi:uncharacterized membrane protein
MRVQDKHLVLRVAGLSALAGMRSLSGPVLLSLEGGLAKQESPVRRLLSSPQVRIGAVALSVGEMFADKLPFMPKRTALPSLCFRALSGAVIGASLYAAEDMPPAEGALVGGASAVAATYLSYHVRRTLTETFHVPDFLVALAEDSFIVARGMKSLKLQIEQQRVEAQVGGYRDNVIDIDGRMAE